jgi:hypothetical protein
LIPKTFEALNALVEFNTPEVVEVLTNVMIRVNNATQTEPTEMGDSEVSLENAGKNGLDPGGDRLEIFRKCRFVQVRLKT